MFCCYGWFKRRDPDQKLIKQSNKLEVICGVLQDQFDVRRRQGEITYLLHNQAKILKKLQIPQDDCRDKNLLFYQKIRERIHTKLKEDDALRNGTLNGRGQTKDESFNSLMEMQDLKRAPSGHQNGGNGSYGHPDGARRHQRRPEYGDDRVKSIDV